MYIHCYGEKKILKENSHVLCPKIKEAVSPAFSESPFLAVAAFPIAAVGQQREPLAGQSSGWLSLSETPRHADYE